MTTSVQQCDAGYHSDVCIKRDASDPEKMQFKLDAWCLFTFDPTLRSYGNGIVTGPFVNVHDFALGLVWNMIIIDMIGKSEFTQKFK